MAAAGMPGGHSTVVTLIPVDNPTSGAAPSVPRGRSTVVTLTRADTRRREHPNGLGQPKTRNRRGPARTGSDRLGPARTGSDWLWNVVRRPGWVPRRFAG